MAALKQQALDHDKYYKELASMGLISLEQQRIDLEAEIANVKDGTYRKAELQHQLYKLEEKMAEASNYTIVGGFRNAMKQMTEAHHNWGDDFTKTLKDIQSNMVDDFASILKNSTSLSDGLKKLWENLTNSIVDSLVHAVAQEIVQHAIIDNLRRIWKAEQIATAAEVGAANAAAASAWSLWGAIGIGFAMGAAIMAFSNAKFAEGGFVGGNSYTGDHVLAQVNSGEMISNTAQQQRLLDIADGKTAPNADSNNGGMTIIVQGDIYSDNVGKLCNKLANAVNSRDPQAIRFTKIVTKTGTARNGESV
jgi:hypothetical protein